MLKINPKELSLGRFHQYMLGAVTPRPISFASTVDANGNANLAPFSYFGAFSADPAIIAFSPARSGRDNSTKHTLDNVLEVPECVVNMVNYAMVQQQSLASTAYDKGVSEFVKAGLTPIESEMVKPFRVKESPVQMECKVREVKSFGDNPGSGQMVICEIVLMHISNDVLNDEQFIDQHKLDSIARMGGSWYSRSSKGLFEIEKPIRNKGMGVDQLPEAIRNSTTLTGNNLGQLGNLEALPSKDEVDVIANKYDLNNLHQLAKTELDNGNVELGVKILMLEYYK